MGLFKGLKVIELASVLAGPSVGQFFAELGAEVIKVENSTTLGDVTRTWKLATETSENNVTAYFSSVNWGKKSIALDITKVLELDKLYSLITEADIVIASYKPGDAESLKVSYHDLKKINPKLIYGHITGYGIDSVRLGYDAIIQAEAGFMYLNGEKNGGPVKMPVALIDILAGHQLKEALLLALIQKNRTGEGAYVSVSLFDTAVASLANQATNYLVGGVIPQRVGSEHPNIVPYGTVFKTKDNGEIVLAVGNDKQFKLLCGILGRNELSANPKFVTNSQRVVHRVELKEILIELIRQFDKRQLLELLNQEQVPAGGVNNLKEVFELEEAQSLLIKNQEYTGVRTFIAKGLDVCDNLSAPPKFNSGH